MQKWLLYLKQKQSSRGVLQEKLFLKISQNLQENTCARISFLIKLQALGNAGHLWTTPSIKTINNASVFWDSRL